VTEEKITKNKPLVQQKTYKEKKKIMMLEQQRQSLELKSR
jgi:hypothetical protein